MPRQIDACAFGLGVIVGQMAGARNDSGDDAGDDQDDHDMRRLLDEIDEVGIEIEVQAVGIGIVLGRTVRDDRSRLRNHPGDAERPADRRGDAEP